VHEYVFGVLALENSSPFSSTPCRNSGGVTIELVSASFDRLPFADDRAELRFHTADPRDRCVRLQVVLRDAIPEVNFPSVQSVQR
jgi:hypothetical protein